jgi:hypothetical protein
MLGLVRFVVGQFFRRVQWPTAPMCKDAVVHHAIASDCANDQRTPLPGV